MSSHELHLHPGEDLEDLLAELEAAKSRNIWKVTLYNLNVSLELASALLDFWKASCIRSFWFLRHSKKNVTFTLEILGCTGCIDRVVGGYARCNLTTEGGEGNTVEQELILQHSHPDHFDSSVFAALGMALDYRSSTERTPAHLSKQTLRLRLYQHVLSEVNMWVLARGIENSHHLRELDLKSCRFTPLTVNRVTQNLAEGFKRNQHLQSLQLEGCELADNQIVCIMEGLRGHPSLETLNLGGNRCRSNGMIALASALSAETRQRETKQLPALSLDLSNQHGIGRNQKLFTTETVSYWERFPAFTTRIVALDLSGNQLVDSDLQCLLLLLFRRRDEAKWSSSIQSLDLSDNDITDQGTELLADIIKNYHFCDNDHNSRACWKRLNIRCNPAMTEGSVQLLAEAMKVNVYLEDIAYATTNTEGESRMIQYYALLNKGGRKAIAQRNAAIPLSVWPLLLAKVNRCLDWGRRYQPNLENARINVLYHLLSQGPILKDRHDVVNSEF